jgi:tetratricopeptide (TPR) repeat protein
MPRGAEMMPALPVLLGLAAAEGLVLLALAQGWWAAAGLLHLGAVGAAWLLPRDASGGWPAAVMRMVRALLPALGPAAVLGGLVALGLGPAGAAPLRDMPDDPLDARLAAVASARDLPDGLLLEALGDVLRWGTPRQKLQAVELAVRDLRPGGEALLRLAGADASPEVRAQASEMRPRAEAQLLRRAEALREAGGPSRGLARHLDRAAMSGLLEPAQAEAFRAEALVIWRRIAETTPGDAEAQAAIGRDLLALGRLDEARTALEAAVSLGVATPPVLGWLAECHYRARDFGALLALIARWRPLLEVEAAWPTPLSGAWRLWLGAR